jgi:hypothetical protein
MNDTQPMYSSKELLEKIQKIDGADNLDFDGINKSDNDIEKRMEEFDFEKRQKVAKAIEDLSKLVITS